MGKRSRRYPGAQYNGHDDKRGRNDGGFLSNHSYLAEGCSREAYTARVRDGCVCGYTEGSYVVYKQFKPEYARRGLEVTPLDAQMQQRCKVLAEVFNQNVRPILQTGHSCPIVVRDAAYKNLERVGPVLLERQIDGYFEKFTSNSGWTNNQDLILDCFSHWTWTWTDAELVVTDLQGHRGEPGGPRYLDHSHYYMLTDPCISSAGRQYGVNDLGSDGISAFFRNHDCNTYCYSAGIQHDRPAYRAVPHIPLRKQTTYPGLLSAPRSNEGSCRICSSYADSDCSSGYCSGCCSCSDCDC